MKRSPEIEAVVRRIWDSGAKADSATFRNLASRSDHILSIGLAAHHWWRGFEKAVGVWELHADEIDVARIEIDYLEGFDNIYEMTGVTSFDVVGGKARHVKDYIFDQHVLAELWPTK